MQMVNATDNDEVTISSMVGGLTVNTSSMFAIGGTVVTFVAADAASPPNQVPKPYQTLCAHFMEISCGVFLFAGNIYIQTFRCSAWKLKCVIVWCCGCMAGHM